MRRIGLVLMLALALVATSQQMVTGKQAHALLDNIVADGNHTLDKAQVRIINQARIHNGVIIKAMQLSHDGNDVVETYVASYDTRGHLIDGMKVAQTGDVKRLREETDNDYVWLVPQGEAECLLSADSVTVTRRFNMEMKDIGGLFMRRCATLTCRYSVRADGTFEQRSSVCDNVQHEGTVTTAADGSRQEDLQLTTSVKGGYNALSLKVMELLYAPISAAEKSMAEWAEMGQWFKARMNQMGVPDADQWSAMFYLSSIPPMIMQGDGRKMVWIYQHQSDADVANLIALMYGGYYNQGSRSDAPGVWRDAAKHLKDKNARKWWKNL